MKKGNVIIVGIVMIVAAIVLFLTHDIIITHILAWQICRNDPHPKSFIKETVEYPESIYWEDNIYPGFDENDRLLMIRNYLDGVHLKTMALNGPEGRIYVYTATEADWQESRDIHARKKPGDYYKTLSIESLRIAERGQVLSHETMPRLNYSVIFNPVSLTPFERRYLWSDEVTITDLKANAVIAYNRRLMRRWYMILPDIGRGGQYYSPEPISGRITFITFDYSVFTCFRRTSFHPAHMGINKDLYRKFEIKKEM